MHSGGGGGGGDGKYPSHTSTLTRIESGINNISRVYHGIVHMVTGADSG